MQALADMTDGDFHHDVLELVYSKFGGEDLTRFYAIYGDRLGDYTRDRHIWLDGLTIEQIMEQAGAESQNKAA